MKIEAIPSFAAWIYAAMAARSPFMSDIRGRVVEEVCGQAPTGKILDVGTGPGYLLFEIAKYCPARELYGIDLSPGMVKISRENCRKLGLEHRVKFELASASDLPFQDDYFDLVISTLSLHHWADPAGDFKEICRVLKPGGSAYIYDFRKDISPEFGSAARKKYGWFWGRLFPTVGRIHSWKSKQGVEDFLAALDIKVSKKAVQEQGAILRIEFRK